MSFQAPLGRLAVLASLICFGFLSGCGGAAPAAPAPPNTAVAGETITNNAPPTSSATSGSGITNDDATSSDGTASEDSDDAATVGGEGSPDVSEPAAPDDASDNDGDSGVTPEGVLEVEVGSIDFGSSSTTATLRARYTGASLAELAAVSSASWLQISPALGASAGEFVSFGLILDRDQLGDGDHSAQITINCTSADSAIVTVYATQSIAPPSNTPPMLSVSPASLYFDEDTDELDLVIENSGGGHLTYLVTSTTPWISTSTFYGESDGEADTVTVTVDRGLSSVGSSYGTITVTSLEAETITVPVSLETPALAYPGFALRTGLGEWFYYQGAATYDDAYLSATLTDLGDDVWQLSLQMKTRTLSELMFPWQSSRMVLGASESDDVAYSPIRCGTAEQTVTRADFDWYGSEYPGQSLAPLVILADGENAHMVASAEWPPKRARPAYCRGRLTMHYRDLVPGGLNQSFRVRITSATGDESTGDIPWAKVADQYRDWLRTQMTAAGLYPAGLPTALVEAHGFLHVGLFEYAEFDFNDMYDIYTAGSADFPWIQFWGQQSNYNEDPAECRTDDPVPPLQSGEQTGCCIEYQAVHTRYLPSLTTFATTVKSGGGYVGFYQRPREPYGNLDGTDPDEEDYLADWIAANQAAGANAFYIDVLGAQFFGNPLGVADNFLNDYPAMSMIEWPVDIYRAGFLAGGALWGGEIWDTEPGETPADFNGTDFTRCTFPRLGRYVMDHEPMFLGVSNGDWQWWGTERGWDHWTERQCFLLGMKFDAPTSWKCLDGLYPAVSDAVRLAIDERERVGWWQRTPRYRDRVGLTNVPTGIDVRVFVDENDDVLFAIDNWSEQTGKTFKYLGQNVAIPASGLSIVELP